MKKLFLTALVAVAAVSGAIGYQSYQSNKSTLSELGMANIDALTESEITVVGCLPRKGATCYVFDGSGVLVDKQKNQYPG